LWFSFLCVSFHFLLILVLPRPVSSFQTTMHIVSNLYSAEPPILLKITASSSLISCIATNAVAMLGLLHHPPFHVLCNCFHPITLRQLLQSRSRTVRAWLLK
jgi:hypothetical protein